ncbi:hypothetical protein L1887_16011 [Cichorium endivia]|nr:hypothetical protein L1887_16011 [Cichorium endivia]
MEWTGGISTRRVGGEGNREGEGEVEESGWVEEDPQVCHVVARHLLAPLPMHDGGGDDTVHEAVEWVPKMTLPGSPRLISDVGQRCPNLHVGSPVWLPLNTGPEEPGEKAVLEVLLSVYPHSPPELPEVALPVLTSQAKSY